jgi:hypothetical protein
MVLMGFAVASWFSDSLLGQPPRNLAENRKYIV